ncbi:hypothetical protein Slala01_61020 [Streptomyces lavendulae subsp. lavendulae]|nr:hypothetical protein Slala01_61020 [Streptomyces lavendulae subsp. lavendulae]
MSTPPSRSPARPDASLPVAAASRAMLSQAAGPLAHTSACTPPSLMHSRTGSSDPPVVEQAGDRFHAAGQGE